MLDNLKDKLICELKEVSKDGVKTANIEYLSKLAETYKNLNKAEKEEAETMIYDDKLEGRYPDDRYTDRRYSDGRLPDRRYIDDRDYGVYGRGRDRDSRGRFMNPTDYISEGYNDYVGARRRYRAGTAPKGEMNETLEMLMKHITMLVEDLYKTCDSDEDRRIMDKYVRQIKEM